MPDSGRSDAQTGSVRTEQKGKGRYRLLAISMEPKDSFVRETITLVIPSCGQWPVTSTVLGKLIWPSGLQHHLGGTLPRWLYLPRESKNGQTASRWPCSTTIPSLT
jgi:hypothetical protein